MRKKFSVVVERTINELNGISCLNWDDIRQPKNEIFSTRSFGQRIIDINSLHSALTTHAAIVAKKARNQGSLIKRLLIFASSSPHDTSYYKQSLVYSFPVATDNNCELAKAISFVILDIYMKGIAFYRCGVGAIELESRHYKQPDLFLSDNSNPKLMGCLDKINNKYGQGTLKLGTESQIKTWEMKRNFLSPQYTSNWKHIPKITC